VPNQNKILRKMKDFRGEEIKIGDPVIYLRKSGQASRLDEGVITEITPRGHIKISGAGRGVTSQNIYKK
jgi:hypothetical protein